MMTYEQFKKLFVAKLREAARYRRMVAEEYPDDASRHMRSSAELEQLAASLENDPERLRLSELHATYDASWEGSLSDPSPFGPRASKTIFRFGLQDVANEERLISELTENAVEDARSR
jgi:hypothetical protein